MPPDGPLLQSSTSPLAARLIRSVKVRHFIDKAWFYIKLVMINEDMRVSSAIAQQLELQHGADCAHYTHQFNSRTAAIDCGLVLHSEV